MRKLFVLLAAVALVVAFTAPARAEVSFYGHILFETYMQDVSDAPDIGRTYSATDTLWLVDHGDSRFGANFKNGDFSANVEIRARMDSLERQWNASWNFGAGTLTIGHGWTPDFSVIVGWAYGPGTSGGYGDPGGSVRADMIQLATGGLKVALAQPYTAGHCTPTTWPTPSAATRVVAGYDDVETSIPKLIASYNLNVGPAAIKLFGAYQTYAERDSATDNTVDIDTTYLGANVNVGFGPAYVKAQYWMGQNVGVMAPFPYPPKTAHGPVYIGTTLTDEDNSAYGVVVGYNISETMKIEAGYEASKSECDAGTYAEDTNSAYYVTLPIKVGKNFTLTPEIIFWDDEDYVDQAGVSYEQGDTTLYGIAWKITF